MEQSEFEVAIIPLTTIQEEYDNKYKELYNLFREYKPTMNQDEWKDFNQERNRLLTELNEKDNECKEALLDIVKQISGESDDVIKQYCDSIIEDFDRLYKVNHGNKLDFIKGINEVVEMYNEDINKMFGRKS